MTNEKSKKEKKQAQSEKKISKIIERPIDFKAKKIGKRPNIALDFGKKKQKSAVPDFVDPKKLENILVGILQKYKVIPKENIYGEGTSDVNPKKRQYKRKKKENVIIESHENKDESDNQDNHLKENEGMGNPEEARETVVGEQEERKEISEQAMKIGVGEGMKQDSSQPKYAYLPEPKSEQGYIDCLELRFEHIIEEKEQIQQIFKTASEMYPNSKEIVEWGKKIENLFSKEVMVKDEQTTPLNTTGEEVDPITGIPIVKLYSLMDNAQNSSMEPKPKQKVFNVSSVPSFDLGIDFDTEEDKRLEIQITQVDTNRELSKMEKDVSTFMHCFVDAPS